MRTRFGRKKGQSASGTAVFLGVMGLVIIIYIVALPPADRDALLNSGSSGLLDDQYTDGGNPTIPSIRALLFTQEGIHVPYIDKPEIKHSFNAFNLITRTEAAVLANLPSVMLSSSFFDAQEHSEVFMVNPMDAGQLLLSFNAPVAKGKIKIQLNGVTIYEGTLTGMSPEPIRLPKQTLLQGENVVTFIAPARIFGSNEFRLTNVQISGIMDDRTLATYEEHFTVTRAEYMNLETTELSFLLNCNSQMNSPLDVYVNNNLIYSTVPMDCGQFLQVDINPELLKDGDNVIEFNSVGSSYLIEQSYIISHLSKMPETLFYFTIPSDVFDAIYMSRSDTFVRMRFTDDLSLKRGVLLVNGFPQTFETDDIVLELPVSTRIIDGTNSIKIEPLDRPIDIQKLEVFTG